MKYESIEFDDDGWFRLSRWDGRSDQLELQDASGNVRALGGAGGTWHSHPDVELTFITQGSGMRYVADHAEPFGAGEAVLIGSRIPHCWVDESPTSGFCLQCPSNLSQLIGSEPAARATEKLWRASQQPRLFNASSSQHLLDLTRDIETGAGFDRASRFFRLLNAIQEHLANDATTLASSNFSDSTRSGNDKSLEAAVAWIIQHYTEPLTVEDAADLSCMSRATFHRRFKSYTGKTFVDFVNHLRLTRALKELRSADRTVLDIAASVGFSSLSHFNRIFRQHYGVTPREARHAAKN